MDLCRSMGNFYPRSPCGERHRTRRAVSYVTAYFYPRSPCGERLGIVCRNDFRCKFLSTLSLRRATSENRCTQTSGSYISIHALLAESDNRRTDHLLPTSISIHALLAESDLLNSSWISSIRNFYPRSPCGERRSKCPKGYHWQNISIHALLAESDRYFELYNSLCQDFYPRSPCGERQ